MNKNIDHKYWMKIVEDVAQASTCRVKIGCIILKENYIVGVGYLGSVSSDYHCDELNDEGIDRWSGCLLVDNKGMQGSGDGNVSCIRTVHAEMNAVLKTSVRGNKDGWLTCYSTYSPCLNCYKVLLQVGVRHFYFEKEYKDVNRDILMKNQSHNFNGIVWVEV
jgi:dCMP deaminase